jgi:hypothetical protein
MSQTNPKLSPLQNNGGPTFTQALLSGSPALEKGNNIVCTGSLVNSLDQRGKPRPNPPGTNCDIGAFEAGPFLYLPLEPIPKIKSDKMCLEDQAYGTFDAFSENPSPKIES